MSHSTRWIASALIAPLLLTACSDSTTAPATAAAPARAFSYAGDGSHVTAGSTLADTLTVFVVGADGGPIANATVTWSADDAGTLVTSSARTDARGFASAIFAAGTRVGTAHITGTIAGLDPATFDVIIDPATPSRLQAMAELSDTLTFGQAYTGGGVKVTDDFGNAIANFAFTTSLLDASGTVLVTGVSTSDERGIAAVPFVVAPGEAGSYRLQYASDALSMNFGITVLAPVDSSSTASLRRVRP
ncbi:MAG: Ig-like domain-containing protein [Gemmatimonadaceae bacterium]|nr:Ig-like domain-containing protein [Gemmatimonadaceae bacterium]